MNALDVLVCLGCVGLLLYIVGDELIRDVLADFRAGPERRERIDALGREHRENIASARWDGIARTDQELERLGNLPCAPDPRRLV